MSELRVNNVAEVGGDAVITAGVLDSGSLPAGSIIAVKDVLKTDTFSASVAAGGNVAVPDLSITHEVADAANKLIIVTFFGSVANSANLGGVGLAIHDGSGFIGAGDAAGSRSRFTAGGFSVGSEAGSGAIVTQPSATFVYTPGSGAKTYTVRAVNMRITTETLFINRTELDNNAIDRPRTASGLVIMEVAG